MEPDSSRWGAPEALGIGSLIGGAAGVFLLVPLSGLVERTFDVPQPNPVGDDKGPLVGFALQWVVAALLVALPGLLLVASRQVRLLGVGYLLGFLFLGGLVGTFFIGMDLSDWSNWDP
ncbi:hypothetical protein [Gordonia sp. (in: high G+C Gram-positive bacteria)]|uniref:hypothetical protein n=1 Tax=Gordonia sp. (in: high G+C Gram-positive bacteria) TaxID=84139 RepID=UPI0039E5FA89